jgi:hypothetical protein
MDCCQTLFSSSNPFVMWKKIDTRLVVTRMIVGNVITDNPDNATDLYVVKSIRDGYVIALHEDGKSAVKFFPESELLNGKWWVKDKK